MIKNTSRKPKRNNRRKAVLENSIVTNISCPVKRQCNVGFSPKGVIPPFPRQWRTQLRFTQQIALTGASVIQQVYRANSLYDPDRSGAGGQPLYYDTISAIYNQNVVIGCRIHAQVINAGTNQVHCSVFPSNTYSFAGNISDAQEQDKCSYAVLGSSTGSASEVFLQTYEDSANVLGAKDPLDSYNLQAATGSNPNTTWNFIAAFQTLDGTNVNATVFFTLDFDVIWTQRKNTYDI